MRKHFTAIAAGLAAALLGMQIPPIAGYATEAPRQASAQVSKDIGLVGNVYSINVSDSADQGALQWDTTLSARSYVLYRSEDAEPGLLPICTGSGKSCSYLPSKTCKGHS